MYFKKIFMNVFFLLTIDFFLSGFSHAGSLVQDNPVQVPDLTTMPVIDGLIDDACWQNIPWQPIDQVWINYGEEISSDDFNGHYKMAWSSETNLLYFLIEIHDDVLVDGYEQGVTADIYNFDIIEVFIDEDKSGGPHINDGPNENAENAFGYHIYAAFPEQGGVTTGFRVEDICNFIGGCNFASHFPEFVLRRSDDKAIWEFSLIVYNDTYSRPGHEESARVKLSLGKELGLSVAYCDNDDPDEFPQERDNFFGSVWVPADHYNDHWMNADWFGTAKLVSEIQTDINTHHKMQFQLCSLYPNPSSSISCLSMNNNFLGNVTIRVYNILGQEVDQIRAFKSESLFQSIMDFQSLPEGMYFIQTQVGNQVFYQKMLHSF